MTPGNVKTDGNTEGDEHLLPTDITSNKSSTKTMKPQVYVSPPPWASRPTPIKKESPFVWEHHLSNEFFGQWLLKYVIPEEHSIMVQAVLSVMDKHTKLQGVGV